MTETLFLSPRFTPDSINLRRAALEQNWQVERLASYRVPEGFENQSIAIYGEALFVTIVAEALNQVLLEAPANWLMNLPLETLQRDIQLMRLEEARAIQMPRFVKPAEGKFFAAKVYQSANELPPLGSQAEGMPVFVAEPVTWLKEFRCFVMEHRLESFSVYARNRDLAEVDGQWPISNDEISAVEDFCKKLFMDTRISMPPSFVLDIGEVEGRGWAVIEANPVWASGIYGADAAKILALLKRSCVPADSLSNEDALWKIQRYSED